MEAERKCGLSLGGAGLRVASHELVGDEVLAGIRIDACDVCK